MAKENSPIAIMLTIKENGFKIIFKDTANYITLLKILPIKVNGNKICLKEKELFLETELNMMIILKLTSETLHKFKKTPGTNLKVSFLKISKKDKEPTYLPMAINLLVGLKIIFLLVKEFISPKKIMLI
jgi:hypothetical protein